MGRLCYHGGSGWCGGQRRWRVKGVMQLWALPAHLPQWKKKMMASTQGQPFEKKSWEESRAEAACLNAVSQRQLNPLSPSPKDILSVLSLYIRAPLFLLFLPLLSVYFNLLLNPASSSLFSPPLHSVPLILLPDYFGSNTQNGGGELESWKAESGSHFLTHPGPGTEDFLCLLDN